MLRRMDKHQSKLLLCGRDEMLVFDMGKLGNPCVFSERYYGELMGLEGDVGGKRVVVRNRGDVAIMRVVDGMEVMDVDVMADGRR